MKGYICIHGHFYQPPRENPWLERIEVQESAYPYHDWNARVHAECYAPNAVSRIVDENGRITSIVNNYEHISFNFGPTLLHWMQHHSPEIYRKIVQADKISAENHGGHGNALAQCYNHMIMPLANRRDKITQVIWGIRSFHNHFGRDPEGMWLPETAVDIETLEILHDYNILFTILSPRQAKKVRPLGSLTWKDVTEDSLDTTMPYIVRLPSGGSITIFFYNGGIAHDIAFGGQLQNAESFVKRLFAAMPKEREIPPLVTVATDGETYGHHHRFGDMALAFALDQVKKNPDIGLTNYSEYLSRFSPTHEVQVIKNSSWSCAHGVERWRSDCGCKAGGQGEWNQKWRRTLRDSFDWLRFELISIYRSRVSQLLKDPWHARNDYIDVIMRPSQQDRDLFLSKHALKPLSPSERSRAFQLLEMQRNAMLMYTSCGWFFDEVSGIEAVQVMSYAARALDIAERCAGALLEPKFIEYLAAAKSNISALGTAADIYRKYALAAKTGLKEVAVHFAISSFFEEYQTKNALGCYTIELRQYGTSRHENSVAAAGVLLARSSITEEEATFVFAALRQELHDYYCAVKECAASEEETDNQSAQLFPIGSYAPMAEKLFIEFQEKGPGGALKVTDAYLGGERYTIKDLFKDEQEALLDIILEGQQENVEKVLEEVYRKTSFITALLEEFGHRIPPSFMVAAETALKRKLIKELEKPKATQESMRLLLKELERWHINLESEWLERTLCERLEKEMAAVLELPESKALQDMNALLTMISLFPVRLNLWETQNLYFELFERLYAAKKEEAKKGDRQAKKWLDDFISLGQGLLINVEKVAEQKEKEKKKVKPKTVARPTE